MRQWSGSRNVSDIVRDSESSDFLISAENKMAPFFHFGTSLGIIGECVSELQVRPWVGKLGVVEVIQQVLDCAV